jgi:hypothetical protein
MMMLFIPYLAGTVFDLCHTSPKKVLRTSEHLKVKSAGHPKVRGIYTLKNLTLTFSRLSRQRAIIGSGLESPNFSRETQPKQEIIRFDLNS